jgi:hypothetical protein
MQTSFVGVFLVLKGSSTGHVLFFSGACHRLDSRIAANVPQGPVTQIVENAIGKYASKGRLKLKQIIGLLQSDFPDLVTSERQVRNVMNKFQRGSTEHNCRSLLQQHILQQRSDPNFYVECKLNEDNEMVGLLWITAKHRRAWLAHPDIMIQDNTYDLDSMDFKLGNFNGIDEAGRTIDLGTSLILDEQTTFSYEWQYSSWMQGMHDVPPTVIGSDADPELLSRLSASSRRASTFGACGILCKT